MALVDKNGLTESEFLAAYKQKNYPKPSLTADIVLFRLAKNGWEVLLIERGGHPFLGCWALPGGFVDPGEDCDEAAVRELAEETGIAGINLEQFGLYSTPGRDPRGWTASGAYIAVVDGACTAHAGDDAANARWFKLSFSPVGQSASTEQCDTEEMRDWADCECIPASDVVYRLSADCEDQHLFADFSVMPQVYGAPRACVCKSSGFAFDHSRIVSDAFLRLVNFDDLLVAAFDSES